MIERIRRSSVTLNVDATIVGGSERAGFGSVGVAVTQSILVKKDEKEKNLFQSCDLLGPVTQYYG